MGAGWELEVDDPKDDPGWIQIDKIEIWNPPLPRNLVVEQLSSKQFRHAIIEITQADFNLIQACQKLYKKLGFGSCEPLLKDGIIQHNRQWGIKIDDYYSKIPYVYNEEIIGVKPLNYCKSVQSFLINNPFICINKHGFQSMIHITNYKKITAKDIKRYKKIYLIPDIDEMVFTSLSDLKIKNKKNMLSTKLKTSKVFLKTQPIVKK